MSDAQDPKQARREAADRLKEAKEKAADSARKQEMREKVAAVQARMRQETIAEHKVESGDTLSGLAAKYYNSAAKEKWMAIYEANKDEIGDNPSNIKVGQVLKIPKLDE